MSAPSSHLVIEPYRASWNPPSSTPLTATTLHHRDLAKREDEMRTHLGRVLEFALVLALAASTSTPSGTDTADRGFAMVRAVGLEPTLGEPTRS
jgi:hypothetical protein